jgi:HKD family nuclease
MKLLATTTQINQALIRLLNECTSCQVAVAWASIGFAAFDLLVKHSHKIEKMVVGTHFYQTHPDFIEQFKEHPAVRFVLNPAGVFHPKIYFFEKAEGEWACIVGSPNFTKSGLSANDEIALLVTHLDEGSRETYVNFKNAIDNFWGKSSSLSDAEQRAYREAWQRKKPILKNLKGKFGNPEIEDNDDHGNIPLRVSELNISWMEYFEKVRSEVDHPPHDHSMDGRLRVIRGVKRLFSDYQHFKDIDRAGRQKIAGLVMDGKVNYLWFGTTRPAGRVKQAIINNNEYLSVALDAIPSTGDVSRRSYMEYVERLQMAFPSGGIGIGSATRLLAMKRPDTFVCLNKRNRKELCKAFDINQTVSDEQYWDSIIEWLKEFPWWYAQAPQSGIEREVWDARVAFLDSLFYDGKDMPVS